MGYKFQFICQFAHKSASCVDFHSHTYYELVYYKSGNGITNISGIDHNYKKKTYTIILPGTLHDENHDSDTDVIFIGFNSDTEIIELENGIYNDDLKGTVDEILQEIKSETMLKHVYYEEKINLLFNQLMIEHKRTVKSPTKPNDEFHYVKKYIFDNLGQEISIRTLAEISGYSYHHFRHLFKQKTGISPMNYIIYKRFEKAKNLLSYSNISISEIAWECGFATAAQFCHSFKNNVGLTPLNFRKKSQIKIMPI